MDLEELPPLNKENAPLLIGSSPDTTTTTTTEPLSETSSSKQQHRNIIKQEILIPKDIINAASVL